jgi:hypothetical protein
VSEVEGRPAVKLSDNYAKALGPASEVERLRRGFGTRRDDECAVGGVIGSGNEANLLDAVTLVRFLRA